MNGVEVVKHLYAVANSCGLPLEFPEAMNPPTAVSIVSGAPRMRSNGDSASWEWIVARITPEQRTQIQAIPADQVVAHLLTLPGVAGYL